MQILDCTLRDGGYVNDWQFGEKVTKKIIKRLSDAHIDIVECGFLSDTEYSADRTIFNTIDQIGSLLPQNSKSKYVAMIALGEKEISYEKLSKCDNSAIFGIRLTFHKHEIERAFDFARNLMDKGYEVFIQPVGTCSYSDRELLDLIEKVNELKPYAFYIVDTLGTITGTELIRLFHLTDHNLAGEIRIGFHSHNNLQLAYANAQELIRVFTDREIILDASVLGMGRGAGNLCTELIAQHMNECLQSDYNVTALLEIVDKYLTSIKEKHQWGYTIPYYISAVHKCHPNYAIYLTNRQTLNMKDIERIIANIPEEKRALYDKAYVARAYNDYLSHFIDDSECIHKLSEMWKNKNILVLAPGRTLLDEEEKVREYINRNHPFVIAVNFDGQIYDTDMLFISNMKRFSNCDALLNGEIKKNIVVTSNISTEQKENVDVVNYTSYLNIDSSISDNSCLMLCKLLKKCNVESVAFAGFDGFISDNSRNYFSQEMNNNLETQTLEVRTQKVKEQMEQLRKNLNITFVTSSKYEEGDNCEKV